METTPVNTVLPTSQNKVLGLLTLFLLLGGVIAYFDHQWQLHTMMVETVHALVVTSVFIFCLACQRRYPDIRQYGWTAIVWGVGCLMLGAWIDILDDPPTLDWFEIYNIPFGRSWQQAFIKKILGYSTGIGLIAVGFFQWIPWMIQSRLAVETLNSKLSASNQKLNRILMGLDDQIASERLSIARELHDDVAQELTSLNIQAQLCQNDLQQNPAEASQRLKTMTQTITETLKSVRGISQNLRTDSLYQYGFIPSLEEFLEKMRVQHSAISFELQTAGLGEVTLEKRLKEHEQLHLFRIIQESVRNAIKHSQAKLIKVTLSVSQAESGEQLTISVLDNGQGLKWGSVMPSDEELVKKGHLGIVGLKERVKELGGVFDLRNAASDATLSSGSRMSIQIDLKK